MIKWKGLKLEIFFNDGTVNVMDFTNDIPISYKRLVGKK
jgi:hypothetical protein